MKYGQVVSLSQFMKMQTGQCEVLVIRSLEALVSQLQLKVELLSPLTCRNLNVCPLLRFKFSSYVRCYQPTTFLEFITSTVATENATGSFFRSRLGKSAHNRASHNLLAEIETPSEQREICIYHCFN